MSEFSYRDGTVSKGGEQISPIVVMDRGRSVESVDVGGPFDIHVVRKGTRSLVVIHGGVESGKLGGGLRVSFAGRDYKASVIEYFDFLRAVRPVLGIVYYASSGPVVAATLKRTDAGIDAASTSPDHDAAMMIYLAMASNRLRGPNPRRLPWVYSTAQLILLVVMVAAILASAAGEIPISAGTEVIGALFVASSLVIVQGFRTRSRISRAGGEPR